MIKPLQTSGSSTFLSFSCFSIANQEAVSRSAALLLRIKALALQKAALVCSFRASGKNCRHLGCGNVMRSRGCAVQNKGITLSGLASAKPALPLKETLRQTALARLTVNGQEMTVRVC